MRSRNRNSVNVLCFGDGHFQTPRHDALDILFSFVSWSPLPLQWNIQFNSKLVESSMGEETEGMFGSKIENIQAWLKNGPYFMQMLVPRKWFNYDVQSQPQITFQIVCKHNYLLFRNCYIFHSFTTILSPSTQYFKIR